MSTLTNIAINSRSMNGLITISDGAGTTIENGTIDTDSLITDTMESINMISDNMIVPRISPNLISILGSNINLTQLCQNMYFDTTQRLLKIFQDNPANINETMITIDQIYNELSITSSVLHLTGQDMILYGNIIFSNSTINFNDSTCAFDSNLPTTSITTGFSNNNFITKAYGDSVYHPLGSYASLPGNNIYTGTNQFNTNLPTSTLTPTLGTELITKTFSDNTYGRLSAINAWTALNTFNTVLPRSTIATATLDAQFITRGIANSYYGRLDTANTWALNNTFSTGIIPRASSSVTDIQIGGNNQLQYRRSPSAYNISIGENAVRGYPTTPTWNVGVKNIGIGDSSLINIMGGSDNIGIGYQTLQGADPATYSNISPSRSIAIGTGCQKTSLYGTDNIALGYNCFPNNGSGSFNILLGSNVGAGLTDRGSNIVIGPNAMASTANDNGVVVVGSGALQYATGSCNSMVAIGASAGMYCSNANSCTFIGGNAGIGNTTGTNLVCIGTYAGRLSLSSVKYGVSIGYDSRALSDNECVFGSEAYSERADLTIPQKVKLNTNQIVGAVTTYNVSWRTGENIIITSPTTNFINLPIATASDGVHLGATFNIIRTSTATSNIYIVANGSETINYEGVSISSVPLDSWVQSISVVCVGYTAGTNMWAVCRYNNRVTLATDSKRLQTLSDSSNINYPVCFTTIATTGYNNVYADSSLNYNPSTDILTVPNLTVTGSLSAGTLTATNSTITNKTGDTNTFNINFSQGTSGNLPICASTELKYTPSTTLLEAPNITTNNLIINNIYKPFETAFIGSNDTVLPSLPSLFGFYLWTDANPSGTLDTIITLPQLTTQMDGCKLTFRRGAYQGSPFVPCQLQIKTPSALFNGLNQLIVARDSCTTISSNTNYVLLTTAVSRLGAFASLVVREMYGG